ncbi:hypothetical protein [Methylorubrum sp. POS3]|uniref:hypothetical protein n=1 Tax=Methylorubrum sp. POS3 TaxID=2998492 RepID=UPI003727175B
MVSELFEAKAITDDVRRLVKGVPNGDKDRVPLPNSYLVDLAAAVAANAFAKSVLGNKDSVPAAQRSADGDPAGVR